MKRFTEYLNEGTKGCSDCEYMKDETDGEIDTCDECAAEERDKARAKTNEAVGDSAEPIYDLCDDLGCDANHPVLDELVRYLDGDTIKDFVADFRRHNDMNHPGEDGDYGDDDANFGEANEELDYLRKLAGM